MLSLLPGLIAGLALAAQIGVGPNVQVSAARPNSPHKEVVIAADAAHSGRLIACSMLDAKPNRAVHTAAYVSFDNGNTWTAPVLADEYFADDPTCAYGPDGTVYFVTKANLGKHRDAQYASDYDYIHIRRSPDGGKTWDPVIRGPQANDRPFMAIDWTKGSGRGQLYIAFEGHIHAELESHTNDDFRHAVMLVTSRDRGSSFTGRAYRALMDQRGDRGANSIACSTVVLSDGTVVVLQHHAVTGGKQASTGKSREVQAWLQAFRSPDGGDSLEPAVKVADIVSGYNSPHTRGVTAAMAADPGSARFKDRLYAAWPEFRSGRGQITVAWSTDQGRTWSKPTAIDDARTGDNFMATIAVNKDGIVGVLWYDRRDNPDNTSYYARFAASLDGGETWTPSVRVSEKPNQAAGAKGDSFSITGGDTAGLTADPAGRFHALWIDNRTGTQQVWTAPVTVTTTSVHSERR